MKVNRPHRRAFRLGTFSVLLLLTSLKSFGQRTAVYVQPDTLTLAGDTLKVAVRSINFDSVNAVQFTVQWDSTVFRYVGVETGELVGMNTFNEMETVNGRLGYVGADPTTAGYGVTDGAYVFTLNFLPLTTVTTASEITFVGAPTGLFMARAPFGEVEGAEYVPGTILLETATSVFTEAEAQVFDVSPNPVADVSQLSINLDYASKANLDLLDASGRVLSRRAIDVRPGRNVYSLSAKDLPASGAYVLRLTTDRDRLTRKVIRR